MKSSTLIKKIFAISFLIFASPNYAAYIYGATGTKITLVSAYGASSVAGDIRIVVQDTVTSCEDGYYITKDDPGKESMLSLALSAFHSGSKVQINAYDSPRWEGGPSSKLCKVEAIHLNK